MGGIRSITRPLNIIREQLRSNESRKKCKIGSEVNNCLKGA